ncbi:MAG: hypothetical protein DBX47_03710 [Clostridiales bacterium]|nr:MAG: hypothetical protein DBX47_03710 [Clostridiales bacterium]
MQNKFEYDNIPENFDIKALAEKIRVEITSMNYSVTVNSENGKIEFWLEKDVAPMEMFLGRWQKLRGTLVQNGSRLTLLFDRKNIADKLVCYVIGIFFFFIPYIFCFVANGNRKDIQNVFVKIVDDYIIKRRSELSEQLSDF